MNAEERAWEVVKRAYEERLPIPRRTAPSNKLLLGFAVALVLAAAVFTTPGRAVLDSVRKAVGVEHAQPALFSLPAAGKLLVVSPSGPWVVHADGSRRRLGDWTDASWSPFGRFVVAARENELAALDPQGHVRWTVARPHVRLPRWSGSRTDTRIAYFSGNRLHIVAGDGTGDVERSGGPAAAPTVAPTWRPGPHHVLAYVTTRGRVVVVDTVRGASWQSARYPRPRLLAWAHDGSRLLLVTRDSIVMFAGPRPVLTRVVRGVVGVSFAPTGDRVALARARDVLVLDGGRMTRVFAGAGSFTGVAWSPDGRWLLVPWREANQWVFVRVEGRHRIRAVSNVARQFGGFPRIASWCCAR